MKNEAKAEHRMTEATLSAVRAALGKLPVGERATAAKVCALVRPRALSGKKAREALRQLWLSGEASKGRATSPGRPWVYALTGRGRSVLAASGDAEAPLPTPSRPHPLTPPQTQRLDDAVLRVIYESPLAWLSVADITIGVLGPLTGVTAVRREDVAMACARLLASGKIDRYSSDEERYGVSPEDQARSAPSKSALVKKCAEALCPAAPDLDLSAETLPARIEQQRLELEQLRQLAREELEKRHAVERALTAEQSRAADNHCDMRRRLDEEDAAHRATRRKLEELRTRVKALEACFRGLFGGEPS